MVEVVGLESMDGTSVLVVVRLRPDVAEVDSGLVLESELGSAVLVVVGVTVSGA